MHIRIIKEKIEKELIELYAKEWFGDMIKFDVDIEKEVLAFGGQLHADGEELLLAQGSRQKDVWGANFYPWKSPEDRIEYTSLINIRPSDGNRDMNIESKEIRDRVKYLAEKLILSPDENI